MIDLHTHTDASDGTCAPAELVARAAAAGVTTLALTDHDTLAGCAATAEACAARGIAFVHGIEITAVVDERDVHVLAYFFDTESAALHAFLGEQRVRRVERVREMVARLAKRGIQLSLDDLIGANPDGARSIGRPQIARALVAAGATPNVNEAFRQWLSPGRPAFVPRVGASPEDVVARVHAAGGIASLAHPGLSARDERIPRYVEAGLDAVEAFHTDHSAADTARYLRTARDFGLLVTGGSDYHGDSAHRKGGPGSTSLPPEHWDALRSRQRAG